MSAYVQIYIYAGRILHGSLVAYSTVQKSGGSVFFEKLLII